MDRDENSGNDSIDDLSFAKADFEEGQEEFSCAFCGSELRSFYYDVNAAQSCEQCRYEVEGIREGGSSTGRLVRAVFAGSLAAGLGALLYYAVVALTGYEIGLIAIAVGFMVGWAVRWGAQYRGGWGYQTLAAALTYVAIVSTYVPLLFQANEEMLAEGALATEGAGEAGVGGVFVVGETAPPADAVEGSTADGLVGEDAATGVETASVEEMGFGGGVVAVVLVIGFLLALPFLGGFENIIGLAIIGFALWQAWSMNQRVPLVIEGPFEVGRRQPVAKPPSAER